MFIPMNLLFLSLKVDTIKHKLLRINPRNIRYFIPCFNLTI